MAVTDRLILSVFGATIASKHVSYLEQIGKQKNGVLNDAGAWVVQPYNSLRSILHLICCTLASTHRSDA